LGEISKLFLKIFVTLKRTKNVFMFRPEFTLEVLNGYNKNNMGEHLGIVFTEIGSDYICATMPVDHRTHQPYGLLHGGASCVLAETMGSIGSVMCVDMALNNVVGVEINANHVRSAKSGLVHAKAQAVHIGRRLHVWEIKINDDHGKLVCTSRLTVAVLSKKPE
jgi:1,4-dihydroxy-2-naphthoyl-CoA hydrolase